VTTRAHEALRGKGKRSHLILKGIVVVAVAVGIVAPFAYGHHIATSDDYVNGELILRSYTYTYGVTVQNATGPFEVILPVPLLDDGTVLPEIDFDRSFPGQCERCATPYGPALRVRGTGLLEAERRGEANDLRITESGNRGLPAFSTVVGGPNASDAFREGGEAWVFSDVEGLTVTIRVGYGARSDFFHWSGMRVQPSQGGGWLQVMELQTQVGWECYPYLSHATWIT
jgi:hypothetical protein